VTRPDQEDASDSLSMNRLRARHALYNSISAVAVQALAILVLNPEDYGVFSLYYLAFAMGNTLCYSALSEAWSRTGRRQGILETWPRYCTMLTAISFAILIPVAIISRFVGSLSIALILGGAVGLSTYRVGARFYSAATGHDRFVGPADLTSGIAMICLYFALHVLLSHLTALSLAWLVSAIVAILQSERPRYEAGYRPLQFIRDHWAAIRILMADSVLSDLGSIGVPLLLSPLLGLAEFGVYRSVSSVALPVRLILNPARPHISHRPLRSFVSSRMFIILIGGAVSLGGAAFVVLSVIHAHGWFSGGVIFKLSSFALPVSVFITFYFVEMFYYLVARNHFHGRRLMFYRLFQLVGDVAWPLLGFFWGDLAGAILGYMTNTVIVCLFSVVLVVHQARAEKAGPPRNDEQ
jgi:hypothetical protein